MPSAPDARAARTARITELLGELFDASDWRRPANIGEQARRRDQRREFQRIGLELARELVRALREGGTKQARPASPERF